MAMTERGSREYSELLDTQGGVVARRQSALAGVSTLTMRNKVSNGRWQRLQRGVYATYSGQPQRETQLWSALLRAGTGATLSHQTAAECQGLIDRPSEVIHITVPASRHPGRRRIPGVIIHRSDSIFVTRHPALSPPCTKVEDTVLDLIQAARSFDEAYDWICRAVGRRRTTAERLRAALNARKKFRWRHDIELALGDVAGGALSFLERRYVHGVERPHGLPSATRQFRTARRGSVKYLDNLYEDYQVCVELDGTAAHPADEQWRDKRRDNQNLAWEGIVTLRFGLLDLRDQGRACATAAEVAALLTAHGLPNSPHPCQAPSCPVIAP